MQIKESFLKTQKGKVIVGISVALGAILLTLLVMAIFGWGLFAKTTKTTVENKAKAFETEMDKEKPNSENLNKILDELKTLKNKNNSVSETTKQKIDNLKKEITKNKDTAADLKNSKDEINEIKTSIITDLKFDEK
ncbi:MAG: hypothetical protein Q2306_00705 [Phytoplasma sp.]|uniref:hypothetical protein n=1 Tax=Phytoplasma sp. TaxID=2155 RepID=UPI002B40612A|nr:hypothetical protein [Phytoplasma sp.]WRH06850.1 MAG: hypothetical protein Q2306_00705 [Phytoplasma sp.]